MILVETIFEPLVLNTKCRAQYCCGYDPGSFFYMVLETRHRASDAVDQEIAVVRTSISRINPVLLPRAFFGTRALKRSQCFWLQALIFGSFELVLVGRNLQDPDIDFLWQCSLQNPADVTRLFFFNQCEVPMILLQNLDWSPEEETAEVRSSISRSSPSVSSSSSSASRTHTLLSLNIGRVVKSFSWHAKGDYLSTVSPENSSRAVLVHRLSTRQSQAPFGKAKGTVGCPLNRQSCLPRRFYNWCT